MLKIGLTGGIGSGKTTVANLFAELGVPIIDTDQIARSVVAPHTEGWQAVVDHFTPLLNLSLIEPHTQQINRKLLREIVFNNPSEKKWLENLLHPLIRAEVDRQVAAVTADYCMLVIPLLFESEYDYKLNRILVIDTETEEQIQRVAERDQVSEEHVLQIISHQVSRKQRLEAADDVIVNQGISLDELRAKVLALHHDYLRLAQSH
jgi:dephospho-CoA kinase